MNFLLDTCAVLWAVTIPNKFSHKVKELLENASTEIFVSAISIAEIACGVARKRIELDRHWKIWFHYYTDLNNWFVIPIDTGIIEEAYSLPGLFHQDPADRIIVTTARKKNLTIVTADLKILDYPHVDALI